MDREVDCSCCQKMGSAKAVMSERSRYIVEETDFETVCLNKAVLRVCMLAYREFRGRTDVNSNRCVF